MYFSCKALAGAVTAGAVVSVKCCCVTRLPRVAQLFDFYRTKIKAVFSQRMIRDIKYHEKWLCKCLFEEKKCSRPRISM